MFYANLGVMLGKLSTFVMNKQVMIDIDTMVELFDMDGPTHFKLAKDFEDFSKDKAVKVPLLDNPPIVISGKILATRLFVEDRLLHYTIVKCMLLR